MHNTDVQILTTHKGPDDSITVGLTVTNTGSLAGKESVLLFVSQQWRIVTPEVKLLKAYQKVGPLNPGDFAQIGFVIQGKLSCIKEELLSYKSQLSNRN